MSETKVQSFDLEKGQIVKVNAGVPTKFEIHTVGGTKIIGIVPASNSLEVTNGGDITKFKLMLDEDSVSPLHIVH